jgi:hypothetical protein
LCIDPGGIGKLPCCKQNGIGGDFKLAAGNVDRPTASAGIGLPELCAHELHGGDVAIHANVGLGCDHGLEWDVLVFELLDFTWCYEHFIHGTTIPYFYLTSGNAEDGAWGNTISLFLFDLHRFGPQPPCSAGAVHSGETATDDDDMLPDRCPFRSH